MGAVKELSIEIDNLIEELKELSPDHDLVHTDWRNSDGNLMELRDVLVSDVRFFKEVKAQEDAMPQRASLTTIQGKMHLTIEYNRKAISILKSIPPERRQYSPQTNTWVIDVSEQDVVNDVIRQFYTDESGEVRKWTS